MTIADDTVTTPHRRFNLRPARACKGGGYGI
jgi:hypothetical protein